jgi:hypothetical protein
MNAEALKEVQEMIQPERVNPFPRFSFLIENRAYFDTSNFLAEMKERLERKLNEKIIDSESFYFDFK